MKAAVFSAALFCAIIIACCATLGYTRSTTRDILDTLDQCIDAVTEEKWNAATDAAYLASALWNHYRPLYSTFLRHNELSEITDRLSRAVILVTVRSREDFLVECGALCELIEYVAGFDELNLENLF